MFPDFSTCYTSLLRENEQIQRSTVFYLIQQYLLKFVKNWPDISAIDYTGHINQIYCPSDSILKTKLNGAIFKDRGVRVGSDPCQHLRNYIL